MNEGVDYNLIFSERLKELMFDKNATVEDFSRNTGISVSMTRLLLRGACGIGLKNMLQIARYFECSLDFLVGFEDEYPKSQPKCVIPFYQSLRNVMKEKNVSRYEIVKNTKIYDSYFTNWRKGKDVTLNSLLELASYLNVSLDYLVSHEN